MNNFIANNMEKKELVVRDLIRKLLEFNMDAKVTINLTGVPFPLYSDFSLCWGMTMKEIHVRHSKNVWSQGKLQAT